MRRALIAAAATLMVAFAFLFIGTTPIRHLLIYSMEVMGQTLGPQPYQPFFFPGSPTGACTNATAAINSSTGAQYFCLNGQWVSNATPSNLNGIIFVDGVTYKTSPDICPSINTAYANLPSTGGDIYVPAGNYNCSTGMSFSTASKPVALRCAPGTIINWVPTTGTMSTWNYGNGTNNPALHDRSAGIYDCTFYGPSSGTSVAAHIGGANGAEGWACEHCSLKWFFAGTAVLFDSQTWGVYFNHAVVIGAPAVNFPNGTTNSGEQISFVATTIQCDTGAYTSCFNFTPGGCCVQVQFVTGSIDDGQVDIATGVHAVFQGSHFENPGQRSDSLSNPVFVVPSGLLELENVEMYQDASVGVTKTSDINISGTGTATVLGGFYKTNATIGALLGNSGSGAVSMLVPPSGWANGYSSELAVTGSGNVVSLYNNGPQTFALSNTFSGGTNTWQFPFSSATLFGNSTSTPTLTGTGACATFSTQVGGGMAGTFKCTGTSGAATITIAPGPTATNGWSCDAKDQTTPADAITPTVSGTPTTTCTFSAAAIASGDQIRFTAFQY